MTIDKSRLRRDRALFYSGLVLFLAGLPGLVLSSWLHDSIRVPLVGETYEAWGWMNETAALIGIVLTVIGAALLLASLRGGTIDASDVKAKGGEA